MAHFFLGRRPSGGYLRRVLHLRVIAPEDLRDDVIGVLQQEVGVANVLLYPGAALDPPATRSPPTSPANAPTTSSST